MNNFKNYLGHAYTKKLLIIYLKFKFIWASCILSGNPTLRQKVFLVIVSLDYGKMFNLPGNGNDSKFISF